MDRSTSTAFAWCVCGFLMCGACLGVYQRHDEPLDATLERAQEYAFAAQVGGGSGTLIAPEWILTAAHVARGMSPFDAHVEIEGERYGIAGIVLHPEARSARPGMPPRVDAALIRLSAPVEGVVPAALYRERDEVGSTALIVGCGDFGPAGGEVEHTDGRRRAVRNVVDRANDRLLFISLTRGTKGLEGEGVGAPGDSGGPLLIVADGAARVAGVSSASDGRPGAYGSTDMYTRVSSIVAWIDETLAAPPGAHDGMAEVRDVAADGFGDDAVGRAFEEFFAAYNSGERAQLEKFAHRFLRAEAIRSGRDERWVRLVSEKRDRSGALTPLAMSAGSDGRSVVRCKSGLDGRLWECVLLLKEEDGLRLLGWNIAPGG